MLQIFFEPVRTADILLSRLETLQFSVSEFEVVNGALQLRDRFALWLFEEVLEAYHDPCDVVGAVAVHSQLNETFSAGPAKFIHILSNSVCGDFFLNLVYNTLRILSVEYSITA